MQKINTRTIVLNALKEHSPISRIDLAKLTKLNKATITNTINRLTQEHLVLDVGTLKRGVGRIPNLLMFNNKAGLCVGVDISVGEIAIIITDLNANILWKKKQRYETNSKALEIINMISEYIKEGLKECPETPRKLLGIGVGVPSQVIPNTGTILEIKRLNWAEVPIGEWLEREFNVPIFIDSKANLSIIAEKAFGKAINSKNALYLSVGIGIGAGIMINNQLYRGASYSGIVGHTVIDPSGPLCICGRKGCWELLGSGLAIKNYQIEETIELANQGDVESIQTLTRIGEYLGEGIANLILTLHPERIILGGRMSEANHWILNPCLRILKTSLHEKIISSTSIEISNLYPFVSELGGVALVLNNKIWY